MMRKIRGYIIKGLAIWLFASAAYGAATIVYDINGITTAKATTLHFLISLVITFIATVAAGYFEIGEWYMFFKKVLPLFIIIYAVITAAVFITIRADARKINKKLGK